MYNKLRATDILIISAIFLTVIFTFIQPTSNDPYYGTRQWREHPVSNKQAQTNTGKGIYYLFPGFATIGDSRYLVLPGYKKSLLLQNTATTHIRYVQRDGNIDSERSGYVLVPVSSFWFHVIKWTTYIMILALCVFAVWVLLILPIRVLDSIMRGIMFSNNTAKHISIIAIGLLGIALVPGIVAVLVHAIVYTRLPPELYIAFPEIILSNTSLLLGGLVLLLVSRAFRKGAEVTREMAAIA